MRKSIPLMLVGLLAMPAVILADDATAVAEIKGCTNAAITGQATLREQSECLDQQQLSFLFAKSPDADKT